MHLLLSFPDHLAAEAEFIASTPVDAEDSGDRRRPNRPTADEDDVSADSE